MQFTRILALLGCFAAGAGLPVLLTSDATDTTTVASAAFHTSSRNADYRTDATSAEMAELRERLWALTSHNASLTCVDAAASAPCTNEVNLTQAN